jgi:hypothetical protein
MKTMKIEYWIGLPGEPEATEATETQWRAAVRMMTQNDSATIDRILNSFVATVQQKTFPFYNPDIYYRQPSHNYRKATVVRYLKAIFKPRSQSDRIVYDMHDKGASVLAATKMKLLSDGIDPTRFFPDPMLRGFQFERYNCLDPNWDPSGTKWAVICFELYHIGLAETARALERLRLD